MSLRERLRRLQPASSPSVAPGGGTDAPGTAVEPSRLASGETLAPLTSISATMRASTGFYAVPEEPELTAVEQLKLDLHRRLIDRLDLEALEKITDEDELSAQIRAAVGEFLREESTPLAQVEREDIVEQIVYEVTGLGPLEPFFRDPTITDILVNGAREIFVERAGRLQRVAATFRNDAHLLTVIDRIVSRIGRRVDESSPMVDARLPDGSRVNAIIPPLALDGPVLSIRRFGADIGVEQLLASGALTPRMATVLAGAVQARLNIVISGGTGSGKTTLLNALSSFIPSHERIITIEDAAELQLQQDHVVRLETRPPNVEGRGEVIARDLVRNALRMRPNRIIIGEVRGAEAVDMLQAMNTGHEGSMATIHANSPRDALSRLENMVLQAGSTLPIRALREQLASTIHMIVQVARLSDGTRRVLSITEVLGIEGDIVTTNEIYSFSRQGVAQGRVVGRFESTGIRPLFADRIELAGIPMPPALFDETIAEELADGFDPVVPAPPRDVRAEGAVSQQQVETMLHAMRNALDSERKALENERRTSAQAAASLERARQKLATVHRQAVTLADRLQAGERALMAFDEVIDAFVQAAPDEEPRLQEMVRTLTSRRDALMEAMSMREVPGVGSPIDQRTHDVVRHAVRADCAPGTVAELVARGYVRDGVILRRAQVVAAQQPEA